MAPVMQRFQGPVLMADLTIEGYATYGVGNALTASVTQTRAGGLPLKRAFNRLTTVANAGDAVTLPNLNVGQGVVVVNDGANPAKVFPNLAADAIDAAGAGLSVPLANAKRCMYFKIATNVIISWQLGAVSA